jgi:arylformamidase
MSKAIYRDYNQEALEYQYGPRLSVPNTDAILGRWAADSETYYAESDCERDISYGPRAEEILDIFKPANVDNAPVLIFIHGGYWRALDKKDHAFLPKPFVDAGVLVVSINYTLCPEVKIDEITRQARAACAWVWRNAASYGGDPDRIHIFGHSAGGHLAAAVATTDWPEYEAGLPKDLLKSATPISGLFDLQPILLISVNNDVHLDPDSAVRCSPANSAPGHDIAMTIAVGGAETKEFRRQSQYLHERWDNKLRSIDYLEADGANHFTVIENMVDPSNILTRKILDHIGV